MSAVSSSPGQHQGDASALTLACRPGIRFSWTGEPPLGKQRPRPSGSDSGLSEPALAGGGPVSPVISPHTVEELLKNPPEC